MTTEVSQAYRASASHVQIALIREVLIVIVSLYESQRGGQSFRPPGQLPGWNLAFYPIFFFSRADHAGVLPRYIKMSARILLNQPQPLHRFDIIKDIAVLAMQVLCQGVDTAMPILRSSASSSNCCFSFMASSQRQSKLNLDGPFDLLHLFAGQCTDQLMKTHFIDCSNLVGHSFVIRTVQ